MAVNNTSDELENCNNNYCESEVQAGFTYLVIPNLLLILKCIRSVNCCLTIFGISTTIINMSVFTRLGITESATSITIFALTAMDFLFLVQMLSNQITMFLLYLGYQSYVPLRALSFKILSYSTVAYAIALLLTVFLAIQKCSCVAMPFHYKFVFTRGNSTVIIAIFTAACIALYYPVLASSGFREVYDASQNSTIMVVWISEEQIRVADIMRWFLDVILPFGSEVVIVVCLAIITVKLRQTTKFRSVSEARTTTENGERKDLRLSGKELRAVKSVVVLAIMFFCCNLPIVLMWCASMIEPEFNDFRSLGNYVALAGNLRLSLLILCSSLNIFVYLKFNTKYKQEFVAIVGMKRCLLSEGNIDM